jgi:hypothetical protein
MKMASANARPRCMTPESPGGRAGAQRRRPAERACAEALHIAFGPASSAALEMRRNRGAGRLVSFMLTDN